MINADFACPHLLKLERTLAAPRRALSSGAAGPSPSC
jgi:hypothetical protein